MSSRPLIGISGRRWPGHRVTGFPESFRALPVDIHLAAYASAVAAAGGIPVQIGVDTSADVIERLDGLVLSGGADIDPRQYGATPAPELDSVEPARDAAELAFCRAALLTDLPMLAICRGLQLLNVALGGTLIQHLRTDDHHAAWNFPVDALMHDVNFERGTLAHELYGNSCRVNSLHHQAIDQLGQDLVVSGRSPDGTLEAVDLPGHRVCAVQWHPELLTQPDPAFGWLIRTANERGRVYS